MIAKPPDFFFSYQQVEKYLADNPEITEYWSATPQLQYVERQSASFMDEPTYIVLQQLWQGSKGSQKWEDVPTVREE